MYGLRRAPWLSACNGYPVLIGACCTSSTIHAAIPPIKHYTIQPRVVAAISYELQTLLRTHFTGPRRAKAASTLPFRLKETQKMNTSPGCELGLQKSQAQRKLRIAKVTQHPAHPLQQRGQGPAATVARQPTRTRSLTEGSIFHLW